MLFELLVGLSLDMEASVLQEILKGVPHLAVIDEHALHVLKEKARHRDTGRFYQCNVALKDGVRKPI